MNDMGIDIVEVCFDERFDKWKVDLYSHDAESGMELHEGEHDEYDLKTGAESDARDLARMRAALLRVETRDGRLQKEERPA
jgi:hypothetical protein